jgi:hypothetical protein
MLSASILQVYKLGLFQVGKNWNWFLQQILPADMPFSHERARYAGTEHTIRDAIKRAHENVDSKQIEYVYMDRHESGLSLL